jgi:Asp-tRNA(Asn)/Glu-tRNA(Gln) amidotransferase A subunit family amidase
MRAAAARREAIVADEELAKGIDRGPLHGIPYGIKDLFNTADIPTTYGAPPFRDQQFDADATVVNKLRDAGAILVAKLSLGELAMGDVWFGGTTRTPWDTSKGSSGSSAGSASAVAACLLPFAIGTETYGSITSPCTACGTTGLRPTFGRVSRAGAMALSWTMDKIGPITRSVDDAALVFAAICGHDPADRTTTDAGFRWDATAGIKGLKIGFDTGAFKRADKSQQAVLDFFKSKGAELIPVSIPASEPAFAGLPDIIIGAEGAAAFSDLISDGRLTKLVQQDDWNWPNTFRIGSLIPAADYISAMQLRSQLQDRMDVALRGVDVYITPGLGMPSITWTNLTGHPTVITRCGMSDKGMPVMIEFTGNLWREDAALRAAYAWEQHRGSDHGWPEIDAAPMTPPALQKEG